MKKPRFNQLRGTPAQKLRHRIALGLTMGAFAVSVLSYCGLYVFVTKTDREPGKWASQPIEKMQKKEFKAIGGQVEIEFPKDAL